MSTRVVFVPGFMQRGDAWRRVAELLPQRYPSTLLDHQAHDFEGRIAEIAEAGKGAVLVGYSLGGRLCLHAALRDPARYAGLVTVGASAGIDDLGARTARHQADEKLATWMETAAIEDVVAVWERQPLFADQSDVLVEEQRPGRLTHDPRELASVLRTAGQGVVPVVWEDLHRLRLPVLALAGIRDERYTSAAKRIAEMAPDASWATIEDSGHAPQLQRPERVAEVLAGFLGR